jgi:Tfp pilus assembly protein PilN
MSAYAKIPNLNLLPREPKRSLLSKLQTYLVIAMVVVIAVALSVYHDSKGNQAERAKLEAELNRVQNEISLLTPDTSYIEELSQEISTVEQQIIAVQNSSETIATAQTLGERPIAIIFEALPPELTLLSITQDNLVFSVTGFSPDARETVEQYRQQLLSYPEVNNAFLWTVLYTQEVGEHAYSFNLLVDFAGGEG